MENKTAGGGESPPTTSGGYFQQGGLSPQDLKVESPVYQESHPTQQTPGTAQSPKPPAPAPSLAGPAKAAPSQGYFAARTGIVDALVALVLALAAFAAVSLSYSGIGHSWDEALYLKPALRAAEWLSDVVGGDASLLKREAIAEYWGQRPDDALRPEIAPVPKVVTGLGGRLLSDTSIDPTIAMRLPVAAFFGLTLAMLYLLAAREYGRVGGLAAAAAYFFMPRVFGHAHIAASETLLAFSAVLLVWAFLGGLRSRLAVVLTALAFAWALNTKVTAVLFPVALLVWGQIYFRRQYASNMFAMLFVAPIAAIAMWPWLWHDTLAKALAYLQFYFAHQSTAVFYMKQMWGYIHREAAPWHYPLVIAGLSLPEWILALAVVGAARAVGQSLRRPVQVLFLFMALLPIAVSSLPGSPKYDGERLFFPAFAFLALLAGGGFAGAFALASRWGPLRETALRRWSAAMALLVLCAWGVVDLARSHPNELNFFNRIVGGPKGAYEAGFETSYWGEALNEEVIDYLNNATAPGMKVLPMALEGLALQNLQNWYKLRRDVTFSGQLGPPYDLIVLQVRQGFMASRERALHTSHKPLKEFRAQGVPRIQIFDGKALGPAPQAAEAATSATATAAATAAAPAAAVQSAAPGQAAAAAPSTTDADAGTTAAAPSATAPETTAAQKQVQPTPVMAARVPLPPVTEAQITTVSQIRIDVEPERSSRPR